MRLPSPPAASSLAASAWDWAASRWPRCWPAKSPAASVDHGILGQPHFPPKAKRIIYLFMSGGPSQLDLFDYKPLLEQAQRRATARQRARRAATDRHVGQSVVDSAGRLALQVHATGPGRRVVQRAAAAHGEASPTSCASCARCTPRRSITAPASPSCKPARRSPAGRASGAWLSYGLGQENANLPSFVVLITKDKGGQPLDAHLWGSGFLPSRHQGVLFRPAKDPVLYLNNPAGVSRESRRMMLDRLHELHEHQFADDSATRRSQSRIDQYEMAFRMQTSIPGRDRPVERAEGSARPLRPRRPQRRARSRPIACWPGGWPSAACGSSSSTTRTGTITADLPGALPQLAARPTSRRPRWSRT